MQCSEISFKDVCSYILYRAMEEEKTTTSGLFESNQLHEDDCKRVSSILEKIVAEGRITMNTCIDSKQYTKKNSVLYTR